MRKLAVLFAFALFSVSLNAKEEKKKEEAWKENRISVKELRMYNGLNGMPAYVAMDGIVYNVTVVASWKGGLHKGRHKAGTDLTEDFRKNAPAFHRDNNVLDKYPRVGVLVKEDIEKETPPALGEKNKKDKAEPVTVSKEEVGLPAVCPVTGDKFSVKRNTKAAKYKNKTYYFCCADCEEKFLKNPEKYIGKNKKKKREAHDDKH